MARTPDPDRSGIAIGARHFAACMLQRPAVGWLELDLGGLAASEPAAQAAAALRAAWPLGLRATGFALGAPRGRDGGGLAERVLDGCAELVARLSPARIVVALAWPDSG